MKNIYLKMDDASFKDKEKILQQTLNTGTVTTMKLYNFIIFSKKEK